MGVASRLYPESFSAYKSESRYWKYGEKNWKNVNKFRLGWKMDLNFITKVEEIGRET